MPKSAAYLEAEQAYEADDYARAYRLLEPLVAAGDAWAQYLLGAMHRWGGGVRCDGPTALGLLQSAAAGGCWAAASDLALACSPGGHSDPLEFDRAVPKDQSIAVRYGRLSVELSRSAADQGDARAMAQLSMHYRGWPGVDRNLDEAIRWGVRAFEHGLFGAANNLCIIFGEEMPDDPLNVEQARHWYRQCLVHDCLCIRHTRFEREFSVQLRPSGVLDPQTGRWSRATWTERA